MGESPSERQSNSRPQESRETDGEQRRWDLGGRVQASVQRPVGSKAKLNCPDSEGTPESILERAAPAGGERSCGSGRKGKTEGEPEGRTYSEVAARKEGMHS